MIRHSSACPVRRTFSWRSESGSDFETISLDADGRFASFLHDRPFTSGTWAIVDGAVVLTAADGTVTRVEGARCASQLFGQAGGAEVRWEKVTVAGALCKKACENVAKCKPAEEAAGCLDGCDETSAQTACLAERTECGALENCYAL